MQSFYSVNSRVSASLSLIFWKLTKQHPPRHRPSLYALSVGGHGVPSFILPKMVQNPPSTARHTREHLSVGVPEATAGRPLIVKQSPSLKDTLAVTHACIVKIFI